IIYKDTDAYLIDVYVPKTRNVSVAEIETVIVGPKEAFVEDIQTNLSMIRRRIKSPRLKVTSLKVGTLTDTDSHLIYIEGLTPPSLVREVEGNMRKLDIRGVTDLNMLTEHLDREQL